jgi:hypothetical protein
LLTGYCAEGHEDGEVDGPCVVEVAPDDALGLFDVLFGEGRRRVWCNRLLNSASILFGLRVEWTMLGVSGGCMLVALELLDDVSWHQNVKGALVIVPI